MSSLARSFGRACVCFFGALFVLGRSGLVWLGLVPCVAFVVSALCALLARACLLIWPFARLIGCFVVALLGLFFGWLLLCAFVRVCVCIGLIAQQGSRSEPARDPLSIEAASGVRKKKRRPTPFWAQPTRAHVSSDSCGVRTHALADWRLKPAP